MNWFSKHKKEKKFQLLWSTDNLIIGSIVEHSGLFKYQYYGNQQITSTTWFWKKIRKIERECNSINQKGTIPPIRRKSLYNRNKSRIEGLHQCKLYRRDKQIDFYYKHLQSICW